MHERPPASAQKGRSLPSMAATDVLTVGLRDYKGKKATLMLHIAQGSTDVEIATFAATLVGDLDLVSGCAVTGVQLTREIDISAATYRLTPADGIDVEKGALFGYDVENEDYRHSIWVPGIWASIQNGEQIDTDPAEPAGILSALFSAPEPGTDPVVPVSKTGGDLLSLIEAVVSFRKR